MRRLTAVLRLRCPRCLTGRVFRGLLATHDRCPDCDLVFEREPGYFMGALYLSYGMSVLLGLPLVVILFRRGVANEIVLLWTLGLLVLASPVLVRYSRVIWLHFDQFFDPR